MAGRPPAYQSDEEKPVSVSLRIPRPLYDQVQHQASQRRITLTTAILDGLALWLQHPADPRESLAYDNSNTVMQQLQDQEQRLTALEAALAKRSIATPAVSRNSVHKPQDNIPYDNGNTAIQESAVAMPAITEPSAVPLVDTRNVRLGRLCPRGHDYNGTGQSLRRATRAGDCVECGKEQKRAKRRAAKAGGH